MTFLLGDDELNRSSVVANCTMNRERQLAGVNSYTRELGFNPVDWLDQRSARASVSWLDLCCGSGRALAQAADYFGHRESTVTLVGVDLVDAFVAVEPSRRLELITASVVGWVPPRRFDLITCVHGLHYIGDKLAVIAAATAALTDDGLFVADLDPGNVRLPDGRPAGRVLTGALRQAGLTFDGRRRRVRCDGYRELHLPFAYLGADDRAGPNYTNQPAVNSYYAPTAAGSRRASRPHTGAVAR